MNFKWWYIRDSYLIRSKFKGEKNLNKIAFRLTAQYTTFLMLIFYNALHWLSHKESFKNAFVSKDTVMRRCFKNTKFKPHCKFAFNSPWFIRSCSPFYILESTAWPWRSCSVQRNGWRWKERPTEDSTAPGCISSRCQTAAGFPACTGIPWPAQDCPI